MEKHWLFLWASTDYLSVMTCYFKDDNKLIYYDRHIVMSVLIQSIIIIYDHNEDEKYDEEKN